MLEHQDPPTHEERGLSGCGCWIMIVLTLVGWGLAAYGFYKLVC